MPATPCTCCATGIWSSPPPSGDDTPGGDRTRAGAPSPGDGVRREETDPPPCSGAEQLAPRTHSGAARRLVHGRRGRDPRTCCGVRGSGAGTVAEAVAGLHDDVTGETYTWPGRRLRRVGRSNRSAAGGDRLRAGGPEDPRGPVLIMPIIQAMSLAILRTLTRARGHPAPTRSSDRDAVGGSRARSLSQPVGEVCGGNKQEVLVGSGLAMRPKVPVLQEPTRMCERGCAPGTPPPAAGPPSGRDRSAARHLGHRGGRRPQRPAPPGGGMDRPALASTEALQRSEALVNPATDLPRHRRGQRQAERSRASTQGRGQRGGPKTLPVFGFLGAVAVHRAGLRVPDIPGAPMNILVNGSVIGIVSLGQALALISGGFDLSVGGVVGRRRGDLRDPSKQRPVQSRWPSSSSSRWGRPGASSTGCSSPRPGSTRSSPHWAPSRCPAASP